MGKYYVGKKECGCIVAAVVDERRYKKDIKVFMKECIEDDLTVEHVDSDIGPTMSTCRCGQTVDAFEVTP